MKKKHTLLLSLAATALFYALAWKSTLLEDLDNKIYDVLSLSAPPSSPERSTLIVEIDEKSLAALGQWPWPRVVMAELLEKIASAGPSATALDLIFPEPDRTSPASMEKFYADFFGLDVSVSGLSGELADNDLLLAAAAERSSVVFPLFFDPEEGGARECFLPPIPLVGAEGDLGGIFAGETLLCSIPILQHAARAAGHIHASPDHDGILRRLPLFIRYKDRMVPTLGVAALSTLDPQIRLASGSLGDITAEVAGHSVAADRHAQVLIRFYPREWYRRVSAVDVLSGRVDPVLLRGKVVFVGASAMGLHDHYTLSDGGLRPGVYVHAALIENVLGDSLILQPSLSREIALLLSALVAVGLMMLMRSRRYLHVLALFFVSAAVATGAGYGMLRANVYLCVGYFLVPLLLYLFGLALVLFALYYRNQKRFYERMSKANAAMIDSMALVAETRDTETGAHIVRTKEYVALLARYLAREGHFPQTLTPEYITELYHAAPLHDIGKVGIPDEILKKNDKLTFEEFEVMKTHPRLGKEIIVNAMDTYKNTTMLKIAFNIAYYHHEKWDGNGYPGGLKGETIPLEARLMALADVYDALISRRRYKEPFSFDEAEEIIVQGRGSHFDPAVVDAFLAIKKEFQAVAERIRA